MTEKSTPSPPPYPVPHAANNVKGMALMLVSTLGFAGMVMLVRVASADLHAFEIAFFRNLFGLLVLVPWFAVWWWRVVVVVA